MKHKIDFIKVLKRWVVISLISLTTVLIGYEIVNTYYNFHSRANKLRKDYVEQQKRMVKQEVMQVCDFINYKIGLVDTIDESIKKELLDVISIIRFGEDGYIFVNSLNGDALVTHGKILSGTKKLWEVFENNQEEIKDLFNKEYHAAIIPEGDYIYYSFIKLSESNVKSPKVSFIFGIPKLQWLIGAGVYLDSIEEDIALMKSELINEILIELIYVILFDIIIISFFLFLFNLHFNKLKNDFNQFNIFFKKASSKDEPIDLNRIKFSNFEEMANNANNMLKDKIEAQQNLRDEREQLFVTIRSVGDGLITIDDIGKIELMNSVAEKLTGWNNKEAKGKDLYEIFNIVDENSRKKVENPVKQVLSENKVVGLANHIILISKDGTEYNIADSAAPIKDSNNKVRGVVLVFRDITKEYKIQEELRQSEARYSRLSDLTYEGILIHDKGVVIDVNSAFERIFGYSTNELIGKNIIHLLFPEKYHNMISENLKNEVTVASEIEGIRKDDSIIKLEIESRNITFINNKRNVRVTAIRDISEKAKMLNDLLVAKEKAENASKMKSVFLAQMSHEIRTPINALVSMASLLRYDLEENANRDQLMSFEIIDRAGDRIIRTVDLLLNLSEIQTGTYEINPIKFDLYSEILAHIVADNKKIVEKNNLKLSITTNTTDTELIADFYTVRQIFIQLIENAVKYTDEGEISVVILRNENEELVVEVKDTGIGIAEEYLSNLFDSFTQEEMGYTRKYEGNGIGLTLVKKYSEINNATVEVESEKNVGSTFRVVFS
jgi:PAS domain S-box-containing protein